MNKASRPETPTKRKAPPLDSTELANEKPGARAWQAHVPAEDPGREQVFEPKDPKETEGSLFLAIGSALAVVGLVDIGLLWYPVQLGSAGWEFATVSRTFTSAPMTLVGLVLMASGLLRRGVSPGVVRGMAFGFAALSFLLVLLAMLFGLAAPAALSQVSGEAAISALRRAMAKNVVEMVVYPITLVVIAAKLLRSVREDK